MPFPFPPQQRITFMEPRSSAVSGAGDSAGRLPRPIFTERASDKLRYDDCLQPGRAQSGRRPWARPTNGPTEHGGPPAQHCAAVALVGLKRYAEGAAKLDELGRAPGMGALRPSLFDQAGNAWMLAGDTGKAITSFQSALALSASDADIYGDLARAQAMQADWPAVESDLNAALAIQPRRPDLLVLRASARHAQNHIADARADVEAALAAFAARCRSPGGARQPSNATAAISKARARIFRRRWQPSPPRKPPMRPGAISRRWMRRQKRRANAVKKK